MINAVNSNNLYVNVQQYNLNINSSQNTNSIWAGAVNQTNTAVQTNQNASWYDNFNKLYGSILNTINGQNVGSSQQTGSSNTNIFIGVIGQDSGDAELQALLKQRNDLLEAEKNKTYDLQQFHLSQGMCGMGMGMGAFDSQTVVSLTGDEIAKLNMALLGTSDASTTSSNSSDDELNKVNNASNTVAGILTQDSSKTQTTRRSIDDIANSLKSEGFKDVTKTADGTGIKFTNKAGKTVTVHDANGDGALNTADYNFNGALSSYKNDLKTEAASLTSIDAKIDARKKVLQDEQIAKMKQLQESMMAMMQLMGDFGLSQNQSAFSNQATDLTYGYQNSQNLDNSIFKSLQNY